MRRASTSSSLVKDLEAYVLKNDEAFRTGKKYATLSPYHLRWLETYTKHPHRFESSTAIIQFIQNLKALGISPEDTRVAFRQEINLSCFNQLSSLILTDIKPVYITNLAELRISLRHLTVRGSLNSIGELLDFEVDEAQPWNLESLNVSQNNIPEIDSSTKLLPSVVKLDLSHNLIGVIENLSDCVKLEIINLSFNRIKSVENINMNIGNIQILSLRHNQISELGALSKLYSLVQLDLAYNIIGAVSEIESLTNLPLLQCLWLEHNPIETIESYRWRILKMFTARIDTFLLDNQKPTDLEIPRLMIEKGRLEKSKKLIAQETPILPPSAASPHLSGSQPKAARIVDISSSPINKKKRKKRDNVFTERMVDDVHGELEEFKKEITKMRNNTTGKSWLNEFHSKHKQKAVEPFKKRKTRPTNQFHHQSEPAPSSIRILQENKTAEIAKSNSSTKLSPLGSLGSLVIEDQFGSTSGSEDYSREDSFSSQIQDGPMEEMDEESHKTSSSISNSYSELHSLDFSPGSLSSIKSEKSNKTQLVRSFKEQSQDNFSHSSDDEFNDNIASDEFCVERVLDSEGKQLEGRILIITKETLKEADSSGNWILQIDSKNILRWEEIIISSVGSLKVSNEPIPPQIKITFQVVGQTQPYSVIYQLNCREDAERLQNILDPIVSIHQRTVLCMQCRFVFEDYETVTTCPRCKSAYVVPHSAPNDDNTTTEESVEEGEGEGDQEEILLDADSVSNLTEVDQAELSLTRANISDTMNLYFSLKMFPTNEEHFIYLLRCSFLMFDVGAQKEKICCFLLSNQNIFILLREKNPKVQFCMLAQHPLSEIRQVVVGLFGQWIRIKTSTSSYVLITRQHLATHDFMHVFRETLLIEDPVTPPPITHSNDITMRNISFQFCNGVPARDSLELYLMGYLCVKSSAYDACYSRRTMKTGATCLTPISLLILSFSDKTVVYLCREDYGSQPKDVDCDESDNQFPIISEQRIHAVLGIELDPERPHYISLCFENNETSVEEYTWDLFIPEVKMRNHLVRVVSRLWQKLFTVELPVLEK